MSQENRLGASAEARLMDIVFPHHTNHLGTLFGGQALALMDKAVFIAASRFARRTVVTASSEKVNFIAPIRQGDVVEVVARVANVGNSSMQVDVELYNERISDGHRVLCTTGRFHMIALDGNGRPVRVVSASA